MTIYLVSDRDIPESVRMVPFWELCAKGDIEGVKAALARGQDVNAGNGMEATGLMISEYILLFM